MARPAHTSTSRGGGGDKNSTNTTQVKKALVLLTTVNNYFTIFLKQYWLSHKLLPVVYLHKRKKP